MKKYRVNTTISQKHYKFLQEQVKKYGTQQRTLEHALEKMDHNSPQTYNLSAEEKHWLRIYQEVKEIITIFPKDFTKVLFETAEIEGFREFIKNMKQTEGALEYYYSKPIKEFSLQEIVDGMMLNINLQGSADTVDCVEEKDHYNIRLTHRLGIFNSQAVVIMYESLFDSYDAKYETYFTERSVFFKLYK